MCACSEAATVIQHRRGGGHPAPLATGSRGTFYSSPVPDKSRNSIPTLCAEIRKDPSVFIRLGGLLTTSQRQLLVIVVIVAVLVAVVVVVMVVIVVVIIVVVIVVVGAVGACVSAVRVKSLGSRSGKIWRSSPLRSPEKGGLMEKCPGSHWPRKGQITLQTSPIISC